MADQMGVAVIDNDVVLSTGLGGIASVGEVGSVSTSQIVTADNATSVLGISTEIQTLKSHANYAGSEWISQTYSLTTTDSANNPIATISIPANYAIAVESLVIGRRADGTACVIDKQIATTFNDAGTTAAVQNNQLGGIINGTAPGVGSGYISSDGADTVSLTVTGEAATTWYWIAKVDYMMVSTSA